MENSQRIDGRTYDQLRPVKMTPNVSEYAEGSVLVEFGNTRVLCTATCEEGTPKWLQGTGKGWVTAEYGMLPRSTHTRIRRDKAANSGRTQEISRLIARSLRAAVDLSSINEKQIIIDCDVVNADGGTRTAAITGGFVALCLALKKMKEQGLIAKVPVLHMVSAVSVGLSEKQALLDLCYEEDCKVGTDMNFVMVDNGDFIEIQGTAEGTPFSMSDLNGLIAHATKGCQELFKVQKSIVGDFLELPS